MKHHMYFQFLLTAVFVTQCQPEPVSDRTQAYIIIALQDVSQTFEEHTPWTPELLEILLNSMARSGKETVFAFGLIGNPSNRSLLRCHLLPVSEPDSRLRLSMRVAHKKISEQNAMNNAAAIQTFLKDARTLLTAKQEAWTDLNNSLQKAATLAAEPRYADWEKILYVHTDGRQDILAGQTRDTILQCPVWPPGLTLYESGWKNSVRCGKMQPLHDPQSFHTLFQSKI